MENNITETEEKEQLISRRDFLQKMIVRAVQLVVFASIPDIAEAKDFPITRKGTEAKINYWTEDCFLGDMKKDGASVYDTYRASHLRPKLRTFLQYMKKNGCSPLPQALTGKLSIDFPMVLRHSGKDLIESYNRWVDNGKSLRDADGIVNTYLKEMIEILELKEGDISWTVKQFLK